MRGSAARRVASLGGVMLLLGLGLAQADFVPTYRPTLTVARAAGAICIDGDLGDPGWQGAACAEGFAEHSPGDATEPPVHSEAWVTYDDQNLYVAFIAHDDPATVRASLCERDNIFTDDYFGIMFDTYGDLAWAYEFFVNPLGIQGDLMVHGDGSEEISFDVVWESHGKITQSGYQVELGIPFASLRFPEREEQIWRFNVWRDHQREVRRRYSWSAINRDLPCWMCQWGTLRGIRGIHPSSNIDLIGSLVGHRVGERSDAWDPQAPFEYAEFGSRASLNVRYGLSSSSSAELTVNPDFSQIESDAAQVDVNSTFALFYPERRPFFQEGSDLYHTWVDAVYTRSINDPWAAVKFTGTFGRTTLLYLLARDRNSPVLLPGQEGSYQPLRRNGSGGLKSVSNILRLRRTLLEDSYIGATVADRRFEGAGGGAGSLVGLDGRVRFLTNYRFEFQVMASYTAEPQDTTMTAGINEIIFGDDGHNYAFDGEAYWGQAIYASIERGSRHGDVGLEYWGYSPEFRTDNGFTRQNDFHRLIVSGGPYFRPTRRLLQAWGAEFDLVRSWDYGSQLKEDWFRPSVWFDLVGQTNLALGGTRARERYQGRWFDDLRSAFVEISTRPSQLLGGGLSTEASRTIYRTAEDPRSANSFYVNAWLSLKLLHCLRVSPSLVYYRLDERHGGPNIFDGSIVRSYLSLQMTRRFHTRVIIQYDSFDERFDLEPLLTYRINPFTVFYLGATSSHVDFPAGAGADEELGEMGLSDARWKPISRQYFAKIQYLWRF